MKKKLYLITTILLSAAVLTMSSCLKDPRAQDFTKVGTLVELPLAAYSGVGAFTPEALPIKSTAQSFILVINVAAPKPLSTPLKVTLKLNTDSLTKLNLKVFNQFLSDSTAYVNDTTGTVALPTLIQYALPPANAYTISSLTATVPANQNTTSISISVITSLLSPIAHYAIPLTISDASGQKISNYNTVFFSPQPKNQWDGIYTSSGYTLRATDPVLTGFWSGIKQTMATTGANSIDGLAPNWAGSGGPAGGIAPITLTINPTTNKVIVTSDVNSTLANDPAYNNHYDPAKKTFYLSFTWSTPGTRASTDTLVYSGSR
jgi:hypothetical protein